MVPHITDAIQDWIVRVAKVSTDGKDEEPDVCIIEVGVEWSGGVCSSWHTSRVQVLNGILFW